MVIRLQQERNARQEGVAQCSWGSCHYEPFSALRGALFLAIGLAELVKAQRE